MQTSKNIEDYAVIGDTHTCALVGNDGSIDWLCLPRFDSGACFAALLGGPENGRWKISPSEDVQRVTRRYRKDTLILETEFETESGKVRLVDFMPVRGETGDLVRIVEGVSGNVPIEMELVIRFDYGHDVPWVTQRHGGLYAIAGPDALILRTPVAVDGQNYTTVASFNVPEGSRVPFVMVWQPSHLLEPEFVDAEHSLQETTRWWRKWVERSTYSGDWNEDVKRSLITLKALTYAPTGGIVAAATTSLPEKIGGVRNWDYRYCWLRDASLTLFALVNCGYRDEAAAWRDWLLRAVAGSPEDMQIMYGVAGERRLTEYTVDWLAGYENSAPVRVGNAAVDQFQLDVYGEVMAAIHHARMAGLPEDDPTWDLQLALLDFLESAWQEPDEGIWEVRGPRRDFTHSKLMAWLAMESAVRASGHFKMPGPVDRWRALRDEIHQSICTNGFNSEMNSFVQFYGADVVDASLLVMPMIGFLPPTDDRIRGTVSAVETTLVEDGLVRRYPEQAQAVDGLPPGEGAFLACTFWLADNYALQGREREARDLFMRLLDLRNDVGLYAEEFDADSGRMVGNFPQAFTHVSMVNAATIISTGRSPADYQVA